jgi:adhesin transport system membrane fusion protein
MALPSRKYASSVIVIATVAVGSFLGWASYAEIDQVSRATGQVIPAGRVQLLQSNDGGVIDQIFVREGDHVRKGQTLVRLDKVKIEASVDEGRAKVAALNPRMIRIEAELFDRALHFPEDLRDFPDFVESQRELFAKRRGAQSQEIAALRTMLNLARQELDMNMPLLAAGDVSRSEIIRLQRAVADMQGQITNKQNRYLQDLQTEYAKTEEELVSAEQTLTQRLVSLRDTEIIAPTDGIVKNVRLTTIGGVLRPGDEVMQIVPTEAQLIVEAKVSPVDIAYVLVGQKASVRFDAYDSSIFGTASGEVKYISPDTLTEQQGGSEQVYYRVHIEADTSTMHKRPGKQVVIQPGMTATAEIQTGKNTVLKFIAKPLVKTVSDSFGER